MHILKNKTMAILIISILMISMSASMILTQPVNAHTPAWTIVSYAYLVASPNPVGIGQATAIVMWIDTPMVGATVTNDVRRHDYTLTITKPDGKIETKHWDIVSDSTSVQYLQYTPDLVGDYTLKFDYPDQNYTWTSTTPGANTAYTGDVIKGANRTIIMSVQQEQIPTALDSYPLPTEYWTRPIEGQNTYWYTISSNWLGTPYNIGSNAGNHGPGGHQNDGIAPNSAHIMWTKPIQYGGLVGGNGTAVPGEMFYSGLSYNGRFANPLIMYGTLYYQEPWGNAATGGDYVAVNLQTGQEQWRINASATGVSLVPSFGYLYSLETPNQHGVLPNGLLIAPTTAYTGLGTVWRTYDPRSGVLTTMNISNVPGGTNFAGPSGEYLKYVLTNLGTTANPNWYLAQWNSSRVFGLEIGTAAGNWYSGNTPANCPFNYTSLGTNNNWNGTMWVNSTVRTTQGYTAVSTPAYDWNISIPSLKGASWTVGGADNNVIPLIIQGDKMIMIQGTFGDHAGFAGTITASMTTDPANVTAISLNPQTRGNVLWTKTFDQAPGNVTRTIADWDPTNNVFIFEDKETFAHYGYSLTTGERIWGPTTVPEDTTTDWNYFSLDTDTVGYGKLFYTGYSGIVYAYDTSNGNLLWTYGNGGAGNSTSSGFETAYGRYPMTVSAIADGKIFLRTTEHSPNSPLFKGALLRAINVTDGKEIWTIPDWGNIMYGGVTPIADGVLTALNTYDSQIYAYGKGPSALSVEAPKASIELGRSLVISGMVTDIAAGTKQIEQAGRFPNGVPAVSDASQSGWMQYVYMQKPKPAEVIGVTVSISVIDANNNNRNIGTTTTDSSGAFSLQWTPDIQGKYTVIATFAGSESYYRSSSETSFAVDPAAPTAAPTATTTASAADLYFVPATAGLFVIIVLVLVLLVILLLRKRP